MSDTETHIGKIRLLTPQKDEDLRAQCMRLWKENGKKEEDFDDDLGEFFGYLSKKYVLLNNQVWEIFDHKKSEYDDILEINLNPDGSYSFVTQFYNGGTCLSEMLQHGMKKFFEKQKGHAGES